MELPNTICMLPWISIETSPIGTARPCCLADEEITDENGQKYQLANTTLENIYHSEYMKVLRRQFRNGEQPATCRRCWDEEAAGRASKRINSRIRLKEYYDSVDWANDSPDQLWFVDLKLGNICNLKCRICGSWSSSRWAEEEMNYMPAGSNKKEHLAYYFLKQGMWPRESPEFWDNLRTLLPQIKYIEFTGGEPFLIKEHFELLRFAVETGDAAHIEIHYNTNGSVYPEEAEEIWPHFKTVEVAFSIDNVGKRFEYERFGTTWDEVNNNVMRMKQFNSKVGNMKIQICMTVNIQNVYYLDELCDWVNAAQFYDEYFNMLHDPKHMCISNLTPEAKDLVINKLKTARFSPRHKLEIVRIIKFVENGTGSDGADFRMKMSEADAYRKQQFSDTHPEIAQAMGM